MNYEDTGEYEVWNKVMKIKSEEGSLNKKSRNIPYKFKKQSVIALEHQQLDSTKIKESSKQVVFPPSILRIFKTLISKLLYIST